MTDQITAASAEDAEYTEKEMTQQLIKVMRRRMGTYSLMARMYRVEADQKLLDELSNMRFPASSENELIAKGYSMIANYMTSIWENTLTELAVDFVRVFIGYGMSSKSAAFPYESVYTSEHHLLMQDSRDEVLALYRAAGLEKDPSWSESEDHIALEFEYIAILTRRAIEALEVNDEDAAYKYMMCQWNFLQNHLINWAPAMAVDMRKFAQTDFYLGLSYLTEGFLADDVEFLNGILGLDSQDCQVTEEA
jgi:putative dimethyl sulfoxide reductase chaperone